MRNFGLKLLSLELKQEFSKNRPGDLLFDPALPIFELPQGIIKTNILIKFEKDWAEIVASRV